MAARGAYDQGTVHAILDEGFLCHLVRVARLSKSKMFRSLAWQLNTLFHPILA